MKSHWTKLTSVAAVIAVAVVSLTVFNRSAAPLYAIEQTLEANRAVRHVYVRIVPHGKGLSEAWAQFDEQGHPVQLRMEFPDTEDGPKTTIWRADKAEVWFKAKNSHLIVNEPNVVRKLGQVFELFDPRLGFESAYAAQSQGRSKVEVQTPADPEAPFVLTVTAVSASDWKEVYTIDRASKRVLKLEKYRLVEGGYQYVSRFEYEYDQEPAPDLFILKPPPDVVRVDQTRRDIGLARGDLTDNEIALKVAREFFAALIADDYVEAGRLVGGLPAEKLREYLGGTKYLRLVSVGSPFPHKDPRTEFICVPCEVETQAAGVTEIKNITLNIRHVYNQPDRWAVGGGI